MTMTLNSSFATSASLTHGFDPRLFYGHSLASDSVTTANLISVYDFGTNKQPRVNSSPGLRLTPVPSITQMDDEGLIEVEKKFCMTLPIVCMLFLSV